MEDPAQEVILHPGPDGTPAPTGGSRLSAPAGGRAAPFVRDLPAGATTALAGSGMAAAGGELSGDGSVGSFAADAAVVPGAPPASVYVRSVAGGAAELLSRGPSGPLALVLTDARYQYYDGDPQTLSADGRYVVFSTTSPGLTGADTPEGHDGVFRRDLRTGDVSLVSRATGAAGAAAQDGEQPSISADGTRVAFATSDALDPADTNATRDAYVRDLAASTTTLASRADGAAGAVGDGSVVSAQLGGDGRHVLFSETATNLGATTHRHAYVRDLASGTTTIADRAADGTVKPASIDTASMSADGRLVVFATESAAMGDGDTDVKEDIHLRDLGAATTSLISRADGAAGAKGDSLSVEPVISGDGSVVAFRSYAENLDTTGAPYGPSVGILAYTRELATSTTRLVSRAGLTGAAPADVTVSPLALSADGAVVAYTISGDFPYTLTGAAPINADAVVVRHRATGAQIVVRVADRRDPSGSSEAAGATAPALNADGSCVAFSVKGTGLLPFVAADTRQVFVRVLSGDCGTATPTAPGGPATPGGPAAAKTTPPVALPHRAVRPVLSKLSLSAKRFRLAAGKTASAAKKATPKGTRIRFTLSAPATVALRFERRSSGRRVGKACLAATAKRAKRKRCTRYLTRFTLLRTVKQAGAVSVAFTGRMGKRRLSPGRYRVVLTATNAGGASKALTAAFTVVRR